MGVAILSPCLLIVLLGPSASAMQTNLRIDIAPLACVIDVTAMGSIAYSSIAPLECEKEISSTTGSTGAIAEALEQTLLASPTTPHSSILSRSFSQPVADGRSIANVSTSTQAATQEMKWQNVTAGAGVIAAATAIVVDGVFFGFASVSQVGNGISANVQKVKSVFGKSSGP